MYNLFFAVTAFFGNLMRIIFLGSLRASELDHIYEQSWVSVTETLFAMTIFREEITGGFLLFFTTLFFFKIFHWLVADRVDYMEQCPSLSRTFYLKVVTLLTLLGIVDLSFITYSKKNIMTYGPSMHILLMFEFLILGTSLLSVFLKFMLNLIDAGFSDPWENKSVYNFYLDLVIDFARLVLYLSFFYSVTVYYGVPLYLLRDLYLITRSFYKRLHDMIQYNRATMNMNERYPEATPEDLSLVDNTCIICREEMTAAKKLPCGHVFHRHCLRSWLERQQTCPTCRLSVLADRRPNPLLPVSVPQGISTGSGRPQLPQQLVLPQFYQHLLRRIKESRKSEGNENSASGDSSASSSLTLDPSDLFFKPLAPSEGFKENSFPAARSFETLGSYEECERVITEKLAALHNITIQLQKAFKELGGHLSAIERSRDKRTPQTPA
ncbi:E3 ubiquitin-protein ligase synoviolin-like [Zophobas morio]|uniref:E3 ubiquitin-protein ligase synoviolin-like n=1 Tax=Zophobas morio TaxID=2755281 RepID=UPI003083C30D